jgi:site-specific DNA-methyltransferase (adenine-specific)/modification methylase
LTLPVAGTVAAGMLDSVYEYSTLRLMSGPGRPRSRHPREVVSLRLDPRDLKAWKSFGADWRQRMVELLEARIGPRRKRPAAKPAKAEVAPPATATLYHADALDLLAMLKRSRMHVDAVISDPPYGMGYRSHHREDIGGPWGKYTHGENFRPIAGDDVPFDPTPWLALAKKKTRLVLWGANYYASRLPNARCWLVWDKREGSASNQQADAEMAWTNLDEPTRVYSHLWMGLIRRGEENVAKGGRKLHPNQKPIALMDWCLTVADVQPGQTVFDPYMGSGTLGVACVRRGIHYVGVEIDPGYFRIAEDRIRQEIERLDNGATVICVRNK